MKQIELLRKAYNVSEELSFMDANEQIEEMKKYIQRFLYANTNSVGNTFNLYKFTTKEEYRPAMECVLHENGFRVASDGHVLAVVKEDYPAEREGKLYKADGEVLEGRYPNWRSVIPTFSEDKCTTFDVDINRLDDLLKRMKSEKKIRGRGTTIIACIDDTTYSIENVECMIMFFKRFPNCECFIEHYDRERNTGLMYAKCKETDSKAVFLNYYKRRDEEVCMIGY